MALALPGYLAALAVPGALAGQVQPAGVDLRVGEVHRFVEGGALLRAGRTLPETVPVEPSGGVWRLPPGGYKIVFMDAVEVPSTAIGFCLPRSSLLRMGAMVACGFWDPGYRGRGEALLIVANPGGLVLEPGARVAQLALLRVEPGPAEPYRGRYLGERLGGGH